MTRGLPFRVTVMGWLVLWFTVWNALRMWTAVAWRQRLAEFVPRPGPLYIGLTGLVFTAAGVIILWTFWNARPWRSALILGTALAYSAWFWADRLLLQQKLSSWPFALTANLLVIVFILFTLRSWFFQKEAYGRDPQDQSAE